MHTAETMIVEYSMIGIHTFINKHVVFDFWRLQFTKTICHTARLRFSKQCILVLLCLEVFCYWSPRTTHYWKKQSTHSTFYYSTVVSSKLTSCINGKSNFSESLCYTFTLKTCSTIGQNRYHLCNTRHTNTRALFLWLQAEQVCCTILFIMPQQFWIDYRGARNYVNSFQILMQITE
jgi:hypothetical protein